jgi:molecular chaperone GrpE (heat shock protein)
LSKYKSQLDTFNEKIGELQMSIDLTELSEMRTQLVCLMEERIANIETKLTEISKKCQIPIGSFVHAKKRKYAQTRDKIETGEKKGESDVVSVEDKNIQKLEQEVIQALASLEHAGDVPVPINQEHYALTENFESTAKIERHDKSRDALSFLKEAELEI